MATSISQVSAASGAENSWQRWAAPVLFKKQHQLQPSTSPASPFHTPWDRCSWLGSLLRHWQLYSQRLVISHLISLQPPYLVYILMQSIGKRGFTIALNAFFYSCFKAVQNFFLVLPLSVIFCSSPKLFNFIVTSVRENQKTSVYFRLAKLKILLLSPPVSYCNSFCLQEIQPAFPF